MNSRATLEAMCASPHDGAASTIETVLVWHRLDDRGLWVAPVPGLGQAEREVMSWHPRQDRELPALSFPFTVHELAAFMLAGGGLHLYERFADDAAAMAELESNARSAAKVMREALSLREAAYGRFDLQPEWSRATYPPAPSLAEGERVALEAALSARVQRAAEWLIEGAHPAPAVADAAAINSLLLATRQQLIKAFGRFTGMDMTWFGNLKDVPALRAARKQLGRGQRGRTTEPMFCPFEVMQWLMLPTRRKGRAFHSDAKPWELLETHFPMVYAAHSAADPRDHRAG